jgi:DNA primase
MLAWFAAFCVEEPHRGRLCFQGRREPCVPSLAAVPLDWVNHARLPERVFMEHYLQSLKQRIPLLDYLLRHNWTARPTGCRHEFVGLCPLHRENHPSFYVNACKNVFYCHGCGHGGDLIRFVQLSLDLSFRETLIHLKRELCLRGFSQEEVLREALSFYQRQLYCHREALDYLDSRGLHDAELILRLGIGYAPGGVLRRHLLLLGYPFDLLREAGLINRQGCDTFYRRIIFPCSDGDGPVNLYGRSIGGAALHRFLARPKGGLFAWEAVSTCSALILVEGLFDLAILWQAGFVNTTCAFGTNLTQAQLSQLCDRPGRVIFVAFDTDANRAGQNAASLLGQRLAGAGLIVRIVPLPEGQDPNSYFLSGATAEDFKSCLQQAQVVDP